MKMLLVALLALLAVSQVAATERPLTEKIILGEIGRAMEDAAGEFDLATRISAGTCKATLPAFCTFEGEGRIKIVGVARAVDAPPTRVSLVYKPDGLAWPLPLNIGLLISIAEPTMTREDRAELFAKIIEATGRLSSADTIAGHNAVFSVTTIGTQIVVTAQAL